MTPSSTISNLSVPTNSNPSRLQEYGLTVARLLASPLPPFADARVSFSILCVAAYALGKQLYEQQKLNTFGWPMAPFAMGSALTVADAIYSLAHTAQVTRSASQRQLIQSTSHGSMGSLPSESTDTNHANTQATLKTVAAALSLAGSFGLFNHWALTQNPMPCLNASRSPAINVFVPLAFAAGNLFKLLMLGGGIPQTISPYARTAIVTGMFAGAVLFQESTRTQFNDTAFFVLATIMTATLAPQLLHSWAGLAQQASQYLNNRLFEQPLTSV